MDKARVVLLGIGNNASAVVQGQEFYADVTPESKNVTGLIHPVIGGRVPADIDFVGAVDVDAKKIGLPLEEAIFAGPNNASSLLTRKMKSSGVIVRPGFIGDGIAKSLHNEFQLQEDPDTVAEYLAKLKPDMVLSLLPTGSRKANEFYAQKCLETKTAFINCIPDPIASDVRWVRKFEEARLLLVGDDVMSQVGATILNRVLLSLIVQRGGQVMGSHQTNRGGNPDFRNLQYKERLLAKVISKVFTLIRDACVPKGDRIVATPSAYVPELGDVKEAEIVLSWLGFALTPYRIELKYRGEDSPNFAAVAFDLMLLTKLALDRGLYGYQRWSAWYCKHPLEYMSLIEAYNLVEDFIAEK